MVSHGRRGWVSSGRYGQGVLWQASYGELSSGLLRKVKASKGIVWQARLGFIRYVGVWKGKVTHKNGSLCMEN